MYYAKAYGCDAKLELSEEQFNSIILAEEKLHEIYNFEIKFDFVTENYFDLQKTILEESLENSLFHNSHCINDFFETDRLINRKMFNFISVAKMYTDQITACVKRVYPEKYEVTKKEMLKFDDKNFSSKLMRALRNHMQHCSISSHLTNGFSDKTNADRSKRFLFFYETLILDSKSFLRDSTNKKEFKNQIDEDSKIEVLDIIKEYFEILFKKHNELRLLLKDTKTRLINDIQTVYEKYKTENNYTFDLIQELLQLHSENDMVVVSTNVIKFINELERKNSHMENASIRFACNASKNQLAELKEI